MMLLDSILCGCMCWMLCFLRKRFSIVGIGVVTDDIMDACCGMCVMVCVVCMWRMIVCWWWSGSMGKKV